MKDYTKIIKKIVKEQKFSKAGDTTPLPDKEDQILQAMGDMFAMIEAVEVLALKNKKRWTDTRARIDALHEELEQFNQKLIESEETFTLIINGLHDEIKILTNDNN